MKLPPSLQHAAREGRLLVVWGAPAFPLAERPPANRANVVATLVVAAQQPQKTGQPQETGQPQGLPLLPPGCILSLDAGERVERAFREAGVPLAVVRSQSDVPARGQHALLKLAGDLATRHGLILSRAELRELHGDSDKRHLLGEAHRACEGGAALLIGCEPADQDFYAWWAALAQTLENVPCFAIGDPAADWPPGITHLGPEMSMIVAALQNISAGETPMWNTEAIRQLLTKAFSDQELKTICFDHFRLVYDDLGSGMGKGEIIQRLVEECERHDQWDKLMHIVRQRNPTQYARFEPMLRQPAVDVAPAVRGQPGPQPPTSEPVGPIRNRWALLVGVNNYNDPSYPTLQYCANDVQALDPLLASLGYTVVVLHDRATEPRLQPTRTNVEAELARLCQAAGPDDLLLVYFTCHGKLRDDKSVLILQDTRDATLSRSGLAVAEVEGYLGKSRVRRAVLMLDACHSGVHVKADLADPEFIKNVYDTARGYAVIAASMAQQVAHESADRQQGIFTYYVLDGLHGKADRDGKRFVTVNDLSRHVLDALKRWSIQHGGQLQEPTLSLEGLGDMILADYRGQEQGD